MHFCSGRRYGAAKPGAQSFAQPGQDRLARSFAILTTLTILSL